MTRPDLPEFHTNDIWKKIGIALALRSDDRCRLLRAAGLDVSRSKCKSWEVGVSHKNHERMPDDALDAVLRYLECEHDDALIAWIAGQLVGAEFQRDRKILPALDRLIELYRGPK